MEEGCMGAKKCGRWNPTGEQVKVLTELFRAGLRTPSTDQIQKISAQLSFYGKIESKNVFYWFQNHKARERHKRRRLKPPSNYVCDKNEACSESERVIETLQLFPLRPFEEYHHTQLRNLTKDSAYVPFSNHHPHPHPPLDLRLSSL